MIGLWPPAPDHETDFAASLRPLNAEEHPDAMNAVRPCAAGLRSRHLTCPAKPAELSVRNRWRTAASYIRPPDGRRHDRPDASHALRNGIASGPKTGVARERHPGAGERTPADAGTAGDRLRCARRKKSFMPKWIAPDWHLSKARCSSRRRPQTPFAAIRLRSCVRVSASLCELPRVFRRVKGLKKCTGN